MGREADVETEIALGRGRGRSLPELYTAYGPRAGRLAFVLTRDRELAEDVAQEAFARLITHLPALRDPDAVEAYLRRSVVNLCRKHWRRVSRERSFLRREGPVMATRTTAQPDVARRAALASALDRLPYRQRAALVLRFYEDLTERQTARALGCAVGTVKSLVFRGLRALREEIGNDDED
ncbi:MAG: SigE family RNA polymerase sigma factor [Actinomycetota bacterium]|nr:SigE family RNA polymerase sigma factor [Actinomycetota bacterium]